MARLLETDEGLSSRFGSSDSIIVFEDYTAGELLDILRFMADRADTYTDIGAVRPLMLSEGYLERSREVFEAVRSAGSKKFGNARFVRKYLHDSLNMQLERFDREYGVENDVPSEAADLLTEEDIPRQYWGFRAAPAGHEGGQ